jgi:F0F1-type ATP synthase membrane subunit c/vacuolar-type H+-ATPase subunit K
MSTEERLAYEARVRNRQVALAAAAGILLILGVAIQLGGPHVSVNEKTLGLITEHKRFTRDLIGSIVTAFSLFAVAATLHYLWGAAMAREPKLRPPFMGWIAIAGGVLEGIAVIVYVVGFGNAASDFVSHGSQTFPEANTLLARPSLVVPQIANYLGLFLLAIALVLVSLNAMRVGLLTRFLGYLGIIGGVLTIIPLVPIPIVEAYWLLALAYLLSGRWPSGVPPAWSSGRAEPWPPRQQLGARGGQPAARGARGARAKPAPTPAPEAVGAPARTPGATRSTTPKRKRKRRK